MKTIGMLQSEIIRKFGFDSYVTVEFFDFCKKVARNSNEYNLIKERHDFLIGGSAC